MEVKYNTRLEVIEARNEDAGKRRYEKPMIEKQEKMTFPIDIIESFNGGRFCVQCSGCHGCR